MAVTFVPMESTVNRLIAVALIATPLILASAGAQAQYTGPGATSAVTTVAEARDQRDDQPVVLQGTLIAKIDHERYRFKDATGEIDVEIDDKDLPNRQAVSATTLVELQGEVDTHRFKPTDIDVEHVRIVGTR